MFDLLISLIGWAGMIILAVSFYLVSNGKIKARSYSYQSTQCLGCIFIALNSLFKGAFPAMFLQIFCIFVSLKTMASITRKI